MPARCDSWIAGIVDVLIGARLVQHDVAAAHRVHALGQLLEGKSMTDIPELTPQQFARAIPARIRKRLTLGRFDSGEDFVALKICLLIDPSSSLREYFRLFAATISWFQLIDGHILRRFVGLTQAQFAGAMGISVHTLRNWEQGRRRPDGPAIALLRIAARHPRIIRENVEAAAQVAAGR
jgi:putative transcriptional regulator